MRKRGNLSLATRCGLTLLGLVVGLSLLAPLLAPYSPTLIDYAAVLEPPGTRHWLGTDDLGRDLFSRLLWGGRESLRVAGLGLLLGLVGGVALGLLAGYLEGLAEGIIMRLVEIILAFPTLLLLLSCVAVLGVGAESLSIALGLSLLPGFARLAHSGALSARRADYVLAAQVSGVPLLRILTRHIAPNYADVLAVYSTAIFGEALLIGSGVSFLGLGTQPPTPEWGAMLADGIHVLSSAWWVAAAPGLAIFVTVLGANLLTGGDDWR